MRTKLLFTLFGVLLGAATAAVAVAVLGRGGGPPPPPTTTRPDLSRFEPALDRAINPPRLESVPLRRAIDALRDAAGVPVEVEWRRLAEVGVGPDTPATVAAQDVTPGVALARLLESASNTPGQLGYTLDEGGIVVTTSEAADARLIVRCYDVRDLVSSEIVIYGDRPLLDDPVAIAQRFGPGVTPTRETWRADELLSAVTDTVAPDSWDVNGGTRVARYFDGRLIVAHHWRAHALVRKLLRDLRCPETLPDADPADLAFTPVRQWDHRSDGWLEPADVDRSAEAALYETVADVDLPGVPLDEAVQRLRDLYGADIHVPWVEVRAAGIDREARVDLRLRRVTLDQALTALPLAVGPAEDGGIDLVHSVRGGTIVLSSSDAVERIAPTRLYNMRDLLPPPAPWPEPPGRRADDDHEDPRTRAVDGLVRALTEGVDPNSWIENGGPVASVREWRGRLIVKQSPRNHRLIESLLDQLRAGGRPAAATPATSPATDPTSAPTLSGN